ncbi:hypothetical protein GCM10007940_38850 [Portibacter lacus]|uniref:Uncharacterized protein n=1 Tax=Portibacter lacus TaxID=1099794 RepID=A0AA37SSW4_9BACT|nr:hypothetical protein GCM10007940_38850 [Portibacter lacus]
MLSIFVISAQTYPLFSNYETKKHLNLVLISKNQLLKGAIIALATCTYVFIIRDNLSNCYFLNPIYFDLFFNLISDQKSIILT